MRTLFLLIIAQLVTSLSAQTSPAFKKANITSLDEPFYFIVPAGSTASALEKLEASSKLYFSYNPDVSRLTYVTIQYPRVSQSR